MQVLYSGRHDQIPTLLFGASTLSGGCFRFDAPSSFFEGFLGFSPWSWHNRETGLSVFERGVVLPS